MLSSLKQFLSYHYASLTHFFKREEFTDEDLKALAASVSHIEKYSSHGRTEEIGKYISKLLEEIKDNKANFENSPTKLDANKEKDYKLLVELDIRLVKIQKIVEKDLRSEK